ncbi:hypothetical protein F5Y07DRAFT_412821 [Xylaria sp. FL0933]|nr:hypothetical protein F5Y07DRAFT_412821 [Xylaria sp. FL0933]
MGPNDQNKKLEEFHLFTALPPELQLMIWDICCEDRPVIYHYYYAEWGRCFYAAYNATAKQIKRNTTHNSDPTAGIDRVLPSDYAVSRVFLPDMMETLGKPHTKAQFLYRRWPPIFHTRKLIRPESPIRTTFNFRRDVFFFGSMIGEATPRVVFPDWFCNHDQDREDEPLCCRIQQLALYPPQIEPDNHPGLLHMKSLKKVFLVVNGLDWRFGLLWPYYGKLWAQDYLDRNIFMNLDEYAETAQGAKEILGDPVFSGTVDPRRDRT